jgi:hypothetical protein
LQFAVAATTAGALLLRLLAVVQVSCWSHANMQLLLLLLLVLLLTS